MNIKVYDFGLRLKELRQTSKLTQQQVADKLGVTDGTVSAYENNTARPTIDAIVTLAITYRVSTDYILGLEKPRQVSVDGLDDSDIKIIESMVQALKRK